MPTAISSRPNSISRQSAAVNCSRWSNSTKLWAADGNSAGPRPTLGRRMAEAPNPSDAMFPRIDEAQIARLAPLGAHRHAQKGEILFDQGDESHGVFIVVKGSIEIKGVTNGAETPLQILGPR